MNAPENRGTETGITALSADTSALVNLGRRLRSLRGGDAAVIDAVLMGTAAIPVLREILFEADCAGIYEPRCRAVRALARIGAYEALIEFLDADHEAGDPVELLGEEAVMNAAARAFAGLASEKAYEVLLKIARRHPLAGAIEVLGEFRRNEIVPILIDALEDDIARDAAEDAIRRLGSPVGPALCEAAVRRVPAENESPSSVRRRRSALRLLAETGLARRSWEQLQDLMSDQNESVAAVACIIAMDCGTGPQNDRAIKTLVGFLDTADWLLRSEIEETLIGHFQIARAAINDALAQNQGETSVRLRRSLARILARVDAQDLRNALS